MATMKVTEKFEMTEADKKWECEKVYMGEGTPTAEEFWKIAKEDHPASRWSWARNRSTWPARSRCSAKATIPPSMPVSTIARRIPQAVRRARLERRGRPAAAQPHAPFPRIPVQDRRGSVRRRLHPLPGRQPETGRHPGRGPRRMHRRPGKTTSSKRTSSRAATRWTCATPVPVKACCTPPSARTTAAPR
jgi:hypothetical protein